VAYFDSGGYHKDHPKKRATIIDKFTVDLEIKTKKKNEQNNQASTIVNGQMNELQIKLTPYHYCQLVNISRLFTHNESRHTESLEAKKKIAVKYKD